jgi:putative endonuclease
MKPGYVYILSNKGRTSFYIGVTSDLRTRIYQHRYEHGSAFTSRYNCHDLVYYEFYDYIVDAIAREKQLKRWHRQWKINLILSVNPGLRDLSDEEFD